jgi:hypothetical protein
VPLLGELMTSRWAFEAVMVRQFKDNDYEKYYYEFEKTIADSDYKTAFYLKQLQSKLAECNSALRGTSSREEIADELELLKYELKKELSIFDKQDLIDWNKLTPSLFDSATFSSISESIFALQKLYSERKNRAFDQKEKWTKTNIIDRDLQSEYFRIKNAYTNDKVTNLVKNQSLVGIMEVGNRLIRKATPIYATPEVPDNPLNFRTFYYAPQKYFAGNYYDTYWVNMIIIWIMALVALLALYLDLLKKIIVQFEKFGDYKFRQQIRKGKLLFRK